MDCNTCEHLRTHGRQNGGAIHCRECHQTWTGNDAQHCKRCHRTFSAISAADAHRYRRLPDGTTEDRCVDPAVTDGWREKRPGVWTDAAEWRPGWTAAVGETGRSVFKNPCEFCGDPVENHTIAELKSCVLDIQYRDLNRDDAWPRNHEL